MSKANTSKEPELSIAEWRDENIDPQAIESADPRSKGQTSKPFQDRPATLLSIKPERRVKTAVIRSRDSDKQNTRARSPPDTMESMTVQKLKQIREELLQENEANVEKAMRSITIIEKARAETVRTAEELMEKARQTANKLNELSVKPTPVTDATKLPLNFFLNAMMENLNEKWKKKKFTLANKEKMEMLKQKYEHVQNVINKVLFSNLKDRLEHNPLIPRVQRLNTFGGEVPMRQSQLPIQRSQIEKSKRFRSASFDGRSGSEANEVSIEVQKEEAPEHDNFQEYTNNFLRKFIISSQATEEMRNKIDSIYMDFAKTEKYGRLYKKHKQELKKQNENFRIGISNMRKKDNLEDMFIDGSDMDQLASSILNNPLILSYIETNPGKFYSTNSKMELDEDQVSDLNQLIEDALPPDMAHLKPKLFKMLVDNMARDKERIKVEQIADMSKVQDDPRKDKWKLNLFLKAKVDNNLQRTDLPRKKLENPNKEGQDYAAEKSKSTEKRKLKYKFIREEEDVDKYNKPNYLYTKHRGTSLPTAYKNHLINSIVEFTNRQDLRGFVTQTELKEEKLEKEKVAIRKQIATLYGKLNNYQRDIKRFKDRVVKSEQRRKKEEKEIEEIGDVGQSVNKLIKQSIVETYELVKNNKKASTIKMYVCSAENYLKKTKRI